VLDQWPQSRTVFDLNCAWLEEHGWQRQPLPDEAALVAHVQTMRQTIPTVLGIDLAKRRAPIYPRIIEQGEYDGYPYEKIFFFSETDIAVTGVLIHPQATAVQTDLLLFENGTHDLAKEQARLDTLLAAHHRVFVFDVRGMGAVQTRPVTPHAPPHDHEYKLGCDAMMLKRSTLGMRVFDALRAYDYLRSRTDVERIGLVGVESGALFAYFAATLEAGFADLTFDKLLCSYHDLTHTRFYDRQRYNLKSMAWGILLHFDLVDLLPCLAPRPCVFCDLRNASGEPQASEPFLRIAIDHHYLSSDWRPLFV